jgi:lysozyme family protein
MTDQFAKVIDRVLAHEGGYINHSSDPGGETNWGISKLAYPKLDIKNLTRVQAIAIYRRDYWDRVYGDNLPAAAGFQVFDAAVNHGVGRAIQWLQEAVGAAPDGVIGPATLGAINRTSAADMVLRFNALRLEFYANLNTFKDFGKGWTRRVAGNLRIAAEDGV